jgi:hypothetical protein
LRVEGRGGKRKERPTDPRCDAILNLFVEQGGSPAKIGVLCARIMENRVYTGGKTAFLKLTMQKLKARNRFYLHIDPVFTHSYTQNANLIVTIFDIVRTPNTHSTYSNTGTLETADFRNWDFRNWGFLAPY